MNAIPASGPRNEKEAEALLTGEPLTLGYRPSLSTSMLMADESGRFPIGQCLRDVENMLAHPDVILPYGYFKSGIGEVKFTVKARSRAEAVFTHELYTRVWQHHLDQLQLCYDYGWCAHEPSYRLKKGFLHFDGLSDLHPLDAWALTWKGKYRGVSLSGAVDALGRLQNGKMVLWGPGKWPAKGLWMSHNRRFNRFYGRTQLHGAWRPWRRLATRDGAEEVIDGGIYRFAYKGPRVRYPVKGFKRPGGGVDYDLAREKAREMAENMKAGMSVALPNSRDEKGEFEWQIEDPEHVLQVEPLINYEQRLQKQIARGVGVPPELFEASDVGSGWSGRKIPLIGFYQSQVKCARNLVGQVRVQLAEPLLTWNYGRGAWCDVDVSILIPQALAGDAGGGQGGEGQPPEMSQPDQQGRVPYQGKRGGKGYKDTKGNIHYGEMSLGDEGYTLAAGVTVTSGPNGETIVVEPRRGKSQGRVAGRPPGQKHDPWKPWVVKSGPRKGQQAWKNSDTGRIVVGKKPAVREGGEETHDAAGRRLGHRAEPLHARADHQEVQAKIKDLLANPSKITADSIRERVEELLSLRVQDIHEVKRGLGLKASGVKAELIRKVVERGLKLVPQKPKGEKKPEAKPPAQNPAPPAAPKPQAGGAGKGPPPEKKAPPLPEPEDRKPALPGEPKRGTPEWAKWAGGLDEKQKKLLDRALAAERDKAPEEKDGAVRARVDFGGGKMVWSLSKKTPEGLHYSFDGGASWNRSQSGAYELARRADKLVPATVSGKALADEMAKVGGKAEGKPAPSQAPKADPAPHRAAFNAHVDKG